MLKTIKKITEQAFKELTTLGGSIFYAFILLLVLLLGELELFIHLLIGLFFSLLIVVLIRTFYFKNRPKKQRYNNYLERIDASSFPSWHAARAIFLASMFSYFFINKYMTGALILTALAVSYSRIYLKKHDWVDILGGLVLGMVTFLLVFLI
ncbi:phosphatase PAP2 family protein [Candidatus Woesearchaeota archaeon]|jgi:undecaprenyl-diphosphatase|nr:phosphatase PAP2 family protein [Candidatus Woesearchaeota archaeon]MBT4111039.1 phosphatase PAP2 family protein [Candidatus Woesearchaeota archaeon]MBT4336908.1 phosphatase PAP2 family protein [Candidatus Woesearchaeota archaeon]MBT4469777.1 phosphatase PAP2 family protein [Candidatus Woesearchaeota archaeon]MBT6743752.1 phosphatase PAP2 family protein [Candidatus Woesearchaeota archaeon]